MNDYAWLLYDDEDHVIAVVSTPDIGIKCLTKTDGAGSVHVQLRKADHLLLKSQGLEYSLIRHNFIRGA